MTAEKEDRVRELLGYSPEERAKLAALSDKKRELLKQLKAIENEIKIEKGAQYIKGRVSVNREQNARHYWRVTVKRIMPDKIKNQERNESIIFAEEKKTLLYV